MNYGNLYYLPVQVARSGEEPQAEEWPHVGLVCAPIEQPRVDVKFFEYGGSADSLLTCWFAARGIETCRLTSPDYDLSQTKVVQKIADEIVQRTQSAKHTIVWVSLPCTSWSPSQSCHKVDCSLRMLAPFVHFLKKVYALEDAERYVHVSFEWPRGTTAWGARSMEIAHQYLQYVVEFDGCAFGLRSLNGALLRKPWRVWTTSAKLAVQLARSCDGRHTHDVTREAETNIYGSPLLVEQVGKAMMEQVTEEQCVLCAPLDEVPVPELQDGEPAEPAGEAPEEIEGNPEHAREAHGIPLPKEPDEVERQRHLLTHLPYAAWCDVCVRSRAKDDSHRRLLQKPGPEVVQLDYTFMKSEEPNDRLTPVLVGVIPRTGYAYGGVAMAKGAKGDQELVADFMNWLREAGVQGRTRLRSDKEQPAADVANAVARLRGTDPGTKESLTIVELSPTKSPASIGAADRWAQTLTGLMRTQLEDLRVRTGVKLRAVSAIFPCVVAHCMYLYNRFQVRINGLTPFEDQRGQRYKAPLMKFGQPVQLRLSTATIQPKLAPRWRPGLWLGRWSPSEEHVVAVGPDTILTGRSCRPLSAETPGHAEVLLFWPTWQDEIVRGVVSKDTSIWEERRITPRPTSLEDSRTPGAVKPEAIPWIRRPKFERTAECPGCEQTGAH